MATVTVADTATLIAAANPNRTSIIIVNEVGNTIWIGENTSVTPGTSSATDGVSIQVGGTLQESIIGGWRGSIYGICASGLTSTVRVWERGQ